MHTEIGEAAWTVLTTGGGQWQRSGMSGQVCGLDLRACLARPSVAAFDEESLEFLLLRGEVAALKEFSAKAMRGRHG